MGLNLHIWVADVRAPAELTALIKIIDNLVEPNSQAVEVVYEKQVLDIYDLAEGFSDCDETKAKIEAHAQSLGTTHATAMFGVKSNSGKLRDASPIDLAYLGAYQLQDKNTIF